MVGHQSSDQPGDLTIRRGTVSWLTHPPEGVGRIEADSRAFHATPVSLPEGDPFPYEATPGELLAIAHATLMASALAESLVENGTPADELIVDAACSFAGAVASRRLVAIDLSVRGHVPGLNERDFDEIVKAARSGYLRASGARDDISGGLETALEESSPSR
jgi:lipoyl-dependent peroxiredoxin